MRKGMTATWDREKSQFPKYGPFPIYCPVRASPTALDPPIAVFYTLSAGLTTLNARAAAAPAANSATK